MMKKIYINPKLNRVCVCVCVALFKFKWTINMLIFAPQINEIEIIQISSVTPFEFDHDSFIFLLFSSPPLPLPPLSLLCTSYDFVVFLHFRSCNTGHAGVQLYLDTSNKQATNANISVNNHFVLNG